MLFPRNAQSTVIVVLTDSRHFKVFTNKPRGMDQNQTMVKINILRATTEGVAQQQTANSVVQLLPNNGHGGIIVPSVTLTGC